MAIKNVLVVDDEKHMQELLKYHLLKNGYEVRVSGNGLEALAEVKQSKPDLIISDVMMPKMDGYEFCKKLREDDGTKTIPFIFLTAKGQLPDKIQGLKIGADDYIVKPFNPEELMQMVKARSKRVEIYMEAANLDELTGIYNLRYLRERLKEDLDKAIKTSQYLAVCFIDIDQFSKVNDTLGHPVGDQVIKRIAEVIKENIRFSDILARYGGEEFVAVLEETNPEDAHRIMERVRGAIENERFRYKDKDLNIKVTVSIGVAGYPKNEKVGQELIEKADKALYMAKEQGRNRVVIYEEEQNINS